MEAQQIMLVVVQMLSSLAYVLTLDRVDAHMKQRFYNRLNK